jgi:hypothetical protein
VSTPAGIVGKMLAGGATEAVSFAAGVAIAPTLAPVLQALENETWSLHPDKPPAALVLASGVAQGQVDEAVARAWAKETGFGDAAMSALIDIANTGPALGLAYSAWRRNQLTDAEFTRALKRTGLEEQWFAALRALKDVLLAPAEIATAVHRNIMRDSSLIVREPPTTAGKVEQVPESPLDPAVEAAGSGIDHERLRVLVGITGLPPGLIQMLQLLNRGEVTEDDVRRSVAQSNLRNEYMDVVLALRRHLLTPHEYQEAALRGILTQAQADAGSALSGMESDDAHLLFQIMGRPLAVHQITTGLARGGTFGGTYSDVPEPYRDAIRRSNIRPEYAVLAHANRYSYPSAFVLRSLAQAGELGDEAAVQSILEQIGWPPELAAKVAPAWVGGGGTADTHVGKAQTQLWTRTHSSYLAGEISEADARTALAAAGVATGAVDQVLTVWNQERDLERKQLTPAQVKKAFTKGVTNPATGSKWTRDDALAALIGRGYSPNDANTFLDL